MTRAPGTAASIRAGRRPSGFAWRDSSQAQAEHASAITARPGTAPLENRDATDRGRACTIPQRESLLSLSAASEFTGARPRMCGFVRVSVCARVLVYVRAQRTEIDGIRRGPHEAAKRPRRQDSQTHFLDSFVVSQTLHCTCGECGRRRPFQNEKVSIDQSSCRCVSTFY